MNKLPEVIQFSNIATKLKLQAQLNFAKNSKEVHSVTFYYQMTLPCKVHFANSSKKIDDVFNRFEDIILGKIYGGVLLEKYRSDDNFKSYLMYDGRNYKIGKSKDPSKRLREIKTGNPKAELIAYSELITEKFLHEVFAHRRVEGEWFNLIDREVEVIVKMMKSKNQVKADALMRMCARQLRRNKPSREESRITNVIKDKRKEIKLYEKAKFSFGKYKGRLIQDMKSSEERSYLHWAYHNMGNLDKTLKAAIKIQIGL